MSRFLHFTKTHKEEWSPCAGLMVCIYVDYACLCDKCMYICNISLSVCIRYVYGMVRCGVVMYGMCLVCFLMCSMV